MPRTSVLNESAPPRPSLESHRPEKTLLNHIIDRQYPEFCAYMSEQGQSPGRIRQEIATPKFAHLVDENEKILNKQLEKYHVRIEAEVFRDRDGERTDNNGRNRSKGSMGLDVTVINTNTGKTVLAFDLKTGKSGTTENKGSRYRKRHNNSPIIDVFVRRAQ